MRRSILHKLFSSEYSHQVLLIFLIAIMFAGPFLGGFESVQAWMSLLFILLLVAAVRTMAESKLHVTIALVLVTVALAGHVGFLINKAPFVESIRNLTTSLFLFSVCLTLLSNIITRSSRVTPDLIFGAVNVYLMTGLAFAFLFAYVDYLVPGSFIGFEKLEFGKELIEQYIYFSYVTLSTLGYGDISPTTHLSTTLVVFEAIFGQLYLAILVARLVGLYIAGAKSDSISS